MRSQLQPRKHTSFKKDAQNMQCLVKSATGVGSFFPFSFNPLLVSKWMHVEMFSSISRGQSDSQWIPLVNDWKNMHLTKIFLHPWQDYNQEAHCVAPSRLCFCCSNNLSNGDGPGPDHRDCREREKKNVICF